MTALRNVIGMLWRANRGAWSAGLVLSIVVLAFGIALLGLAGWFITASALAGLLGVGLSFDFFRPSAGVRFFALGRTAARYGERITTHDATLRSLANLRVQLLAAVLSAPLAALQQLRSTHLLNRLTSDVDTLDAVPLRLVLPVAAALSIQLLALVLLAWLVDWRLAVWIVGVQFLGGIGVLAHALQRSRKPARLAEMTFQRMRRQAAELGRMRTDLLMSGRMPAQQRAIVRSEQRHRRALAVLDRQERQSGFLLQLVGMVASTGALVIGSGLFTVGDIDLPQLALALFASLALLEALAPLRRGVHEVGRFMDAAERIEALLQAREGHRPARLSGDTATDAEAVADDDIAAGMSGSANTRADLNVAAAPLIVVDDLTYRRHAASQNVVDGLSFTVAPGERLALVGPSGGGKSTVLWLLAGLLPADAGRIVVSGHELGRSTAGDAEGNEVLRHSLTLLPQRSALISGTVADALRLGQPDLSDDAARALLEHLQLAERVRRGGGLTARIGEAGAGFSGGEQRRLALARVLARRTPVILLDEPTEGLDRATAEKVLAGIDAWHPDAAIVLASHRVAETAWATRVLDIG